MNDKPFEPFTVGKLDPASPITKFWPDHWETPGDELYQTISIQPDITCLVGKNESGKTAFVQALYRLNPARANAKFSAPDQMTPDDWYKLNNPTALEKWVKRLLGR